MYPQGGKIDIGRTRESCQLNGFSFTLASCIFQQRLERVDAV